MNEREIRVWPDGWWQPATDALPADRSDDCRTVTVHAMMPDEEVDRLALMAANGAPDEAITSEVVFWMGG